ncbi:hypothetical protein, partial [Streptomyces albidoflavus]|uniref:hypothetical protein n=1 Tax=Streptomyces albidoflavus TaxID=1886 RepID=UPI00211C611E
CTAPPPRPPRSRHHPTPLCLAGFPPLALWAAKDLLLADPLPRDPGLYATGLAAAALAAVYGTEALWALVL